MRYIVTLITILSIAGSCSKPQYEIISKEVMKDKVEGAWLGKMIGVMYGRSMEFAATDRIYEESIEWSPEMLERSLLEDDLYGQMNFMMTFEQHGLDVAVDSLVKNFAEASFPLCHANLQARKNYFAGVPVSELAYPENSIHAEDIDFQIESDFIGFIHPYMPQASNRMCEKVGSIMAYGDGMYGGMFVSAMHTLAFGCNDVEQIVTSALKAIPSESAYAQCIEDVVDAYKEQPDDWRYAWEKINTTWAAIDICCPYHTFNIDAKLNGAYIAMALLYGKADFERTMEIAVRCGQDTDCNTANAAAVLGIIYGASGIPDIYKSHLPQMSDKPFLHTTYSYDKAVNQTLDFIAKTVVANGGKVTDEGYFIVKQEPTPAEYKVGFQELRMKYQVQVAEASKWRFEGEWEDFVYGDGDNDLYKLTSTPGASFEIDFEGSGVALLGSWNVDCGDAEIYIDGQQVKVVDNYYMTEAGKYDVNRAYLFHDLSLADGEHTLKVVNAASRNERSAGNKLYVERILVYE